MNARPSEPLAEPRVYCGRKRAKARTKTFVFFMRECRSFEREHQRQHRAAAMSGRADLDASHPAQGDDVIASAAAEDSSFASLASLRPIMEGARARGVADACDLLGVAAVLLDRTGGVLHLTAAATSHIGTAVKLVEGHLVAADPRSNSALEHVIAAALAGDRRADEVSWTEGVTPIRAMPFPGSSDDGAQLVKAVLLLGEAGAAGAAEKPARAA